MYSIKYSNSMAPNRNWTTNVHYPVKLTVTSSAVNSNPVKSSSLLSFSDLPTTYIFERPVFANVITMRLNWTSVQKSPYFELRGCDLEGELLKVNSNYSKDLKHTIFNFISYLLFSHFWIVKYIDLVLVVLTHCFKISQ